MRTLAIIALGGVTARGRAGRVNDQHGENHREQLQTDNFDFHLRTFLLSLFCPLNRIAWNKRFKKDYIGLALLFKYNFPGACRENCTWQTTENVDWKGGCHR